MSRFKGVIWKECKHRFLFAGHRPAPSSSFSLWFGSFGQVISDVACHPKDHANYEKNLPKCGLDEIQGVEKLLFSRHSDTSGPQKKLPSRKCQNCTGLDALGVVLHLGCGPTAMEDKGFRVFCPPATAVH